MPLNLHSGAKIGSTTSLAALVAIWPQKCKQFFQRPCHWLDRWDTQAIRLGSAFLAGAFVFWENTTWKKLCVSDQRSLQGLLFSGKNTTWKKVVRLGSVFLAGAFVPQTKCSLRNEWVSYLPCIEVPLCSKIFRRRRRLAQTCLDLLA